MYKLLLRPLLFKLQAEKAHNVTLGLLKNGFKIPGVKSIFKSLYGLNNPKLERELFGIKFPNPIGLAAGLDKNAEVAAEMHALGFGFIEVGTVTPKPQDGNPQPRLFRLKEDTGLINRMGFNNKGVESMVERLKKIPKNVIIGGNIGKNKLTPNENAVDDYVICFEALFDYVHYFVVNVSSPNTPGLRDLQDKEPLTALLNELQHLNNLKTKPKPILLKIAPDLTNEQLDDIVEILAVTKISGVIATNTTISRENLITSDITISAIGNGGLSGKPLKNRSTEVIRYLKTTSKNAFPIIGVGGICSAEDALEKIEAGADLIQVYSGFVYEGPAMIKKICQALAKEK
ncbi:MAG: quinone-dependent dihydroorotate dehydrogenase [Flavobacteriales bacterium]